jgi:pimeloyl-ACP methyl ester carboxylesterase
MVDAGGHQLEMILMGEGTPAVVFDAGMSGGMAGWTTARDAVVPHTRTVILERAGFGGSEEGPSPRTAEQLATELRAALRNAGVAFPVVLVGHSVGGMFSVVYTRLYPSDVAGFVLVDSATDSLYDHMRENDRARWENRSDPASWAEGWQAPPGWVGQMDALPQSVEQFRASWPLTDIPTVVLTALSPVGGYPLESAQDMLRWERFQSALVARIPGVEQVVLPHANHGSILGETVLGEKIIEIVKRASGCVTFTNCEKE